ncbi:hypothetical protein SAMN05660657_05563 [Geodermatophilus amargosae]|uniref:Uncharacterized protein n=1 Tax=Geodermatophilus amargosae TaxID=1296565 RepID=A0A1I7DB02_9ACTN|nr:hypothetical protein SAMN05660657_05563 [Geodermatophilus amargosae]
MALPAHLPLVKIVLGATDERTRQLVRLVDGEPPRLQASSVPNNHTARRLVLGQARDPGPDPRFAHRREDLARLASTSIG